MTAGVKVAHDVALLGGDLIKCLANLRRWLPAIRCLQRIVCVGHIVWWCCVMQGIVGSSSKLKRVRSRTGERGVPNVI